MSALQADDRVVIHGLKKHTDFNGTTGTLVEFLTHGQYWSAWYENQPNTNWCKPNRWVVRLDRGEFPVYGFVEPTNLRKI